MEDRRILDALRQRLEREVAEGRVAPERAATLREMLEAMPLSQGPDETVGSLVRGQQALRALQDRVMNLPGASHGLPPPPEGSRARAVAVRWAALQRELLTLAARAGQGAQERARLQQLVVSASLVDRELWAAGGDDARTAAIESDRARPLAAEVRQLALLPNLAWARPDVASGAVVRDPSTVSFAGRPTVKAQLDRACRALGLTLLPDPRGEDVGVARWRTLRAAGLSVLDLSLAQSGPARAAVAYEFGLARATGTPVIVLCDAREELPFDVAVEPIVLTGDASDEQLLVDALDGAAYGAGGVVERSLAFVDTARRVIARLGHTGLAGPLLRHELAPLLDVDPPDPLVVESFLRSAIGLAGVNAGELMTPAWPPRYPAHGRRRLFHVMPFGQPWSRPVSQAVSELCGLGAEYVRHDDVADEHIIRSLWDEIGRATHVLVDLTGLNLNVAVELGFAHALGKTALIVGQPGSVGDLFPAIAKRRVREYDPRTLTPLLGHVRELLDRPPG